MKFSTTDGRVMIVPDMCGHCQLTTGGQHESHCPFAKIRNFNSTQSILEPEITRFPKKSYREYVLSQ